MNEPIYEIKCALQGSTHHSLETLDRIIASALPEYHAGKPIHISELRRREPSVKGKGLTYINLELKTDRFVGLTGEGFWVPGNMQYSEVIKSHEGGTGTWGYQAAIAKLYRNFNKQARNIIEVNQQGEKPKTNGTFVIEDPETIKLHPFLLDLQSNGGWNFVVLDISTQKNGDRDDFIAAATWDMYSGIRHWYQDDVKSLLKECNQFDHVVTFNGNKFDWNILKRYGPEPIDILENKSIDIYDGIKRAVQTKTLIGPRSKQLLRGSTKLETIAMATLGLSTNVFNEQPQTRHVKRTNYYPVDQSSLDVEITKELFFHIMGNKEILFPLVDQESNTVVMEKIKLLLPWYKKSDTKSSL